MMLISCSELCRRDLLKLGGAVMLPGIRIDRIDRDTVANTKQRSLWIVDSQYASSVNAGQPYSGDTKVINVVEEHRSAWRQLRNCEPVDIAAGITLWSDFLIVRGHLESLGMRLIKSIAHKPVFHWLFVSRDRL